MHQEKKVLVIKHVANPIGGGDGQKVVKGFVLVTDKAPNDSSRVYVEKDGVRSDVPADKVLPED